MTFVSTFVATRLSQPRRAFLSVLNRSLTGKDTRCDTVRLPILQILWGIVHSANLDFASLIWDGFEWQTVDNTINPTNMSDSEMHSEGQNLPITKLTNNVKGTYKFEMEIPDTMISDAFKESTGYKYYKAKKAESEKAKAVEEPKEQHVSQVRRGLGKGYMHSGDQKANVPSTFKKNVVPRKTRSLTVTDNIVKEPVAVELAKSINVKDTYVEWGKKLKGHVVEDPVVQSLLDLHKGTKASRLESMKQIKQAVAREGSSAAHDKYYEFDNTSAINSDATQGSSCSNIDKEKDN
ncbi:hypothetical protein Tco_0609588 [Tanacetum coccineum]